MLRTYKEDFRLNIKNIPGWRTRRKIVVIECDDWGGIRMPSKSVYETLTERGLKIDGWFNLYDTIETQQDLEKLFDSLVLFKDQSRNPAVITPVTNVANPDFEKIRASGFSQYHYELFTETLKRYYQHNDVFGLWKEGITAGIFKPEFHGREHIAVQFWLKKLQAGDPFLMTAFNNGFAFLDRPGVPEPVRGFGTVFFFDNEEQKPFLINSIEEGVFHFTELFGYKPGVFVPGNGLFHQDFVPTVAKTGIQFLNVNHKSPYPIAGGNIKYRHYVTGLKDPSGITYYIRNCAFEPASPNYKGIGHTLRQIEAAFRWWKPAIISTHRVNFAGGIVPANRNKGLQELRYLLKEVLNKWPDVEFMGAGEALEVMRNNS